MKWAHFPEKLREVVAKRALAKMDTNIHNYHHMGWPLYRNRGSQDHYQLDTEEMTGCTRLLKETYTQPINQLLHPSLFHPDRIPDKGQYLHI